MKNKYYLLGLTIFLSGQAFGLPFTEFGTLQGQVDRTDRQVYEYNQKILKLRAKVADSAEQLNLVCDVDLNTLEVGSTCNPSALPPYEKRMTEWIADLEEARPELAELEASRDKYRKQATNLRERSGAKRLTDDEELDLAFSSLSLLGAEAKLQKSLSRAQGATDELEAALVELEGNIDRTAAGLYLQDKIGQLVNSNLFCRASNRCEIKGPTKVEDQYLREVFPGYSPGRNARSGRGYYNRTRKGGR